jgi:hypothetical protein
MRYDPRIKFIEDNINYEVYDARSWDGVEKVAGFVNLNHLFITEEEKGSVYMQYTGFKDSIGKFIYEADILRIDDYLYKVYWHEDNNWAIKGIHGAVDADMTRGIIENDSIVMGNIYEHPELLEKSE